MTRNVAFVFFFAGAAALGLASTSCSSTLAQPFQGMKGQPITIYRLQNYEPPAAQADAAQAAPLQLPPQIQQWLGGAAQMLPPGLIPPGLLPGGTPAPAPAENVPRFYNFRILGSVSVTDADLRNEILNVFGKESNWAQPRQSCMYAEFGFQIGQPPPGGTPQGAPSTSMPADILVSLSCDQVQMFNYGWPHGSKTGMGGDTQAKIDDILRKAFGG